MTLDHRGRRGLGAASLLAAALLAVAFGQAAAHYGGFPQPALDLVGIPIQELGWQALYLAFGLPLVALAVLGADWSGLSPRLGGLVERACGLPRLPVLLALLVPLGAVLARVLVLREQSVTDDEEVYLFIARTLLKGRVVNPLPADPEFFRNQFVVLNDQGWFGKYPVGHGLVLALGLATGTLNLVQGLVGGATAWVTWLVGREILGPRRALLGLALLVLSPHFLLTHATLLSQPIVALTLMAATLCTLRWERTGRPREALLAGLLVGLGILARPMPGVLLALGPLAVLARAAWRRPGARWAVAWYLGAAGAGLVALGLVHLAQTGSPLRGGYQEVHRGYGVFRGSMGQVGLSVVGGLWRENFWLFGWPFSLAALVAARGGWGRWLLWSPVLGALAYRVAVPKTVVSVTGPTYLLEMVPALALLSADGLARLRRWVADQAPGHGEAVLATAVAATAVAWLFFWPVELRALERGAMIRGEVWEQLPQDPATRSLVFANELLEPTRGASWAYFPPNPSPDLDDRVLFLRWPGGPDAEARARDLARRRFPDRRAWRWVLEPQPRLLPLFPATPGEVSGPGAP